VAKICKAVFLDRDGVINESVVKDGKPYPPADPEDVRIYEDVPRALARLKERGFLLIVVTNQPDVARGRQTKENVELIHSRMRAELPLDDVFTCFHDNADQCDCRKPKPGLMLRAAKQYGIDLKQSYLAGDRWRDIDAGATAGCKTILIERDYDEQAPNTVPDARVTSLSEAADWILSQLS